MIKKFLPAFVFTVFFFLLTFIYLYPLKQGLILLPLDLLISKYSPWYAPGTILLKNPYMQDSIIQLFPWKHLVFQSFQSGIIPFWNPYQMLGGPFMASMKPMIFYPLNLLYFLGEVRAWNSLLFLQIFLSMVFTYLLSRDFEIPVFPSILASISFSLNSLMIGVLEFGSDGQALIWLPLFILLAKKYLEKKGGKYLFLLSIFVAVSIFAGQLQYTGYGLVLLIAFIFYHGHFLKTKIQSYLFLLLSIFLGIGISAIQLIPSLELFSASYRGISNSYIVFSRGLMDPSGLFRLLSPDFFGNPVNQSLKIGYIETSGYFGIIPLFFALYAIVFAKKNIFVKFFTAVFVLSILLSLREIGLIIYLLKIPLFSSASGERIFYLVHFSGALLAGFGLMEFLSSTNRKMKVLSLILFSCIFITAVAGTAYFEHLKGSALMFIANIKFACIIFTIFFTGTVIFLILKSKNFLKIFFLLFVVLLTFFDLFRMGYHFLTFSNLKFLYPETAVATFVKKASANNLSRNIGLTQPEIETYLNVYSVETYNPLYIQRTAELINALQRKPIQDLPINTYFVTKNENLKYALDFLGVNLFVVGKDGNPSIDFFNNPRFQADFNVIHKDDKYAIYENKNAFPRFSLFYDIVVMNSGKEILDAISNRSIDLKNKLILEENLPVKLGGGTGSAVLLSSNVNSQKFEINTNKPAFFYVSDTYFPGWKAIVNNEETKIYRADYNLKAVLIPKGKSVVEFSYIPTRFILSIWVTLISLGLIVLASIFHKKVLKT